VYGFADDHSHNGGTVNVSVQLNGTFASGTTHSLWIVSESFGYPNDMPSFSSPKPRGISGSIAINGQSIAADTWTVRSDTVGNELQVWSANGAELVQWTAGASTSPLTWLQTTFTSPVLSVNESLLVNVTGLGRGHLFVNGFDLGRYWTILRNDGSGRPTQALYPIPFDLLNQGGSNRLVVGETLGATNPAQVSIVLLSLAAGPSSVPYTTWLTQIYDCQY
jgi:hypothetical protein